MKLSKRLLILGSFMLLCAYAAWAGKQLFDLGMEAYNAGQYDMALNYFNQEVAATPSNGYAWAYKGSILLRQYQDAQGAADALKNAVGHIDEEKDAPFAAWTYYEYYGALDEMGDKDGALTALDNAIRLNGNDGDYYQDRAILHYNNRNLAQAEADALRAAELQPEAANNYNILGRTYMHQGRNAEAITAFEKAATLAPTNAESYSNIAAKLRELDTSNGFAERDTVTADGAVLPEFPGGAKALAAYVKQNLQYPQAAIDTQTEGTVYVDCVIDKQGRVTKPTVAQGISPELDAEAVRVVSTLPPFTPASLKGKPIDCNFQIAVRFRLGDTKTINTCNNK